VDGAVLPATVASGAIASGAARLIGWGSDEAPWQIGAAFASAKVKADEATIGKFLTAYKRACKLFHDKLDAKGVPEAERAPLLETIARYTNQKPEAVARTLAFVEPDAKLDLPNVAHQIEWYQAHGFVDKGFGLEQVIDRRFVKN
ncbi:MAG: ABC transporter substrate-binding protein, partial [Rhodoblastus sp.]|nr:ABC transporter substrate-binding protein [Rhodoblastus sp.]